LVAHSGKKTWLVAHSGEKHGWQHILGKNMISSTFWEKTRLAAHSRKINMVGNTFWGNNMIGSKFWEKT
jgi:hypothetical protein